jgi:phosphoribosyl 1,2-cyclic phosphodiesterase
LTALLFLGTGASGGTPGQGRSARRESSLLVEDATSVLIDVTRAVDEQLRDVNHLDFVLLTHAHRDASGGIPRLRRWCHEHHRVQPLPVLAHPKTLAAIQSRYARLDHCQLTPVTPGRRVRLPSLDVTALEVPHDPDPAYPTVAWRLTSKGRALVYASDVASLPARLARFSAGADVLVMDGATYGRGIFTHLRIDRDLPAICRWQVDRVLLTQIGRSAPPHDELARLVTRLCSRARPAYDGLRVTL